MPLSTGFLHETDDCTLLDKIRPLRVYIGFIRLG